MKVKAIEKKVVDVELDDRTLEKIVDSTLRELYNIPEEDSNYGAYLNEEGYLVHYYYQDYGSNTDREESILFKATEGQVAAMKVLQTLSKYFKLRAI